MLEAFIDAPQRNGEMTVFPILAPGAPILPYLLSTKVLDSGALTWREMPHEAVPMLMVRNNSLHPLLLLQGEPLPGGNPGRLVERSILLAGKHVTQIPASSTESGGWVPPDRESEITEWLKRFPVLAEQVGSLAFQGNRLLGLEALGSTNLYAPLHRRLLIRFLKEALAHPAQDEEDLNVLEQEAQALVEAIEEANRVTTKRVGLGAYNRLDGAVAGGELIHEGHLVHLSVHLAPLGLAVNRMEEGGGKCS